MCKSVGAMYLCCWKMILCAEVVLKITIIETLKIHFLLVGGDFELAGGATDGWTVE